MLAPTRVEGIGGSFESSARTNRQIQLGSRAGAALLALALAHLSAGASDKALVVARGLHQLAPDDPRYLILLCVCLCAENGLAEAQTLLERVRTLPDGGGRQVALSARMLAAALHWERGREQEGVREFRDYMSAARVC